MAAANSNNTGILIVQAYTADQALPLPDVNVVVSRASGTGEELVKVMKTNRSGKTQPLELSAPPAENSQSPDAVGDRFYKYNIRVDLPGYYSMENVNVPIFAGQTAIQPFALIPLPLYTESGRQIVTVEEEPVELE